MEKAISRYGEEQRYAYMRDAYSVIIQIYQEQGNKTKMDEIIKRSEKDLLVEV